MAEIFKSHSAKTAEGAALWAALWTGLWAFVLFLGGCEASSVGELEARAGDATSLRVLVAASALQATDRSIAAFRTVCGAGECLEVELVAGPSNGLARQVLAGGDGDLFISADPRWIDSVAKHCRSRSPLVSNQLVIGLNVGNKLELKSLADLAASEVGRIAIATQSVPVGDYARQAIEKLPITEKQAIQNKLVFAKDSSALLAWLESEVVDAAIIYRSDLSHSQHLREAIAIESSQYDPIVYTIACLKTVEGKERDLADALYRWLRSEEGQAIFAEAGFGPAP